MPWRAADRPVTQHQTAQVDREKAAAVNRVGQGKDRKPPGNHQNRVQAGRQIDAVDQLQQDPAAAQADETADAELLNQMPQQPPVQAGLTAGQHADQG
ncbi:hypothetical protein Pgy4_01345, partial [Pseudomonas savastanoi pv. glycinea str. race 4]